MKHKLKKVLIICICLGIALTVSCFFIEQYVQYSGQKHIVEPEELSQAEVILILGAYVHPDGTVSPMLADRLTTGWELYEKGKAPKIIVSGDHGQKNYDEVNAMKDFLLTKGVPPEDVFMDHAGFNTYNSIYRARDVFAVNKVIVVTQEYHLKRALFIARELGVEAFGVVADRHNYGEIMRVYETREKLARIKDFLLAKIVKPLPKYLGDVIPVSGDGRVTDDF